MRAMLISVAAEVWDTYADMAPYLLVGFLVGGALSVIVSQEAVERHLGGRGFLSALKASVFGVPLPLCSCGVLPVAASLRNHGATRGAAASFLISTPQTGVDSIIVTYSLLGPVFAVFRPLVALVSGVVGGTVIDSIVSDPAVPGEGPRCAGECCGPASGGNRLRRALRYGFVTLPRDIALPLLAGVVVAGAVKAVVPEDFLARYLVGAGFWAQLLSMIAVLAMGLPVYVCAAASVPLAVALLHVGFSPGAALVFMVAGPATNAASIAIVWKLLGRRTAAVYAASVAVFAVMAGVLLNLILEVGAVAPGERGAELLPDWLLTVSAFALSAVLAWAFIRRKGVDRQDIG